MRLARDQLLSKAEAESESNTKGDADANCNALADTHAVTNSDTFADTEG